MFCTSEKPMEGGNGMVGTPCDLTKPRIAPYRNTWKRLRSAVFWCILKFAQEKGLQFYQTRSHAVVLHNTLFAEFMEKAVCMKTQEELYKKIRLTPRVRQVALESNSQHGPQDPQNQDVRSSWETSSTEKSVPTQCTTQYLEYFLQSSSSIQHATTKLRLPGETDAKKKPDRENTDAIQRYFHDGTPTKNTETHCQPQGGKNTTQCCTTESPWRSTSTPLEELKEFKILNIDWIITANSERSTQQSQAKRECKRLHDEHLARTQQEYRAILRSQQKRKRKGQHFEGNEEYDNAVDPKTSWVFYKQSRGNLQTTSSGSRANLQTASSSSPTWDQTKRKTSTWNF